MQNEAASRLAASFCIIQLFHDAEDVFQRLGVQLFRLCYKCLERLRVDVPFIEELLGRHIEVLADVKESLHGGQGFLVFDVVDICSPVPATGTYHGQIRPFASSALPAVPGENLHT